MKELGIHDERLRLPARLEQVQLLPLVSARVHRDEDPGRAGDEAARDRLGLVGELLELAARERDAVELHRPGQVRLHEGVRAARVDRDRGPQLEQLPQRKHGWILTDRSTR